VPLDDFPILPTTKVGALLDRYPELEDILIGLAPPFKKLKNPLLRKGVAKITHKPLSFRREPAMP
jgi:hypothetical protein